MFLVLVAAFVSMHIICAVANVYTTSLYLSLASAAKTKAQYAVPLYDSFFIGSRADDCVPGLQEAYDVALWLMGVWAAFRGFQVLQAEQQCPVWEYVVVMMFFHTLFMCACQVSTILPSSGGIQECLDANPNGVEAWPWYGVSFVTQSFAGGRGCADMIYSGHMSVFMILAYGISTICKDGWRWWAHMLMSFLLGGVATYGIVKCQDHYTVDVVLALGISLLLFTCPQLEQLAHKWAGLNVSIEQAVVKLCTGVPTGLGGREKQS